MDIGKNRDKEIDFIAGELNGRLYYLQVSYSVLNPDVKERELSAFYRLDDGYQKILITMDRNPLKYMENGLSMLHLFDFPPDSEALEKC